VLHALDGKALRRARDGDGDIRNIVSAWAESNRLVLGQFKMADKSNEITAVPELLRALELSGCSVTTDAMGCQKKIAREIIEADAHNHETAHEEVKAFLDEEVIRHAKPVPPRMACHWVLDVVMREDDSRTRTGHAAENLATASNDHEPAQSGQNQETRNQGQAAQCFMGSRIPPAPLGFLDASALRCRRVPTALPNQPERLNTATAGTGEEVRLASPRVGG